MDMPADSTPAIERVRAGLDKRNAAERRFQLLGKLAIALGLLFLVVLIGSIATKGYTAFWHHKLLLEVTLDEAAIDPDGTRDPKVLAAANYRGEIRQALFQLFPEVSKRRDKRKLGGILSSGAQFQLRDKVLADPSLVGKKVLLDVVLDDEADMFLKGHISRDTPEADRRVKDDTIAWLDRLQAQNRIQSALNTTFFTAGDSRDPEPVSYTHLTLPTITSGCRSRGWPAQ